MFQLFYAPHTQQSHGSLHLQSQYLHHPGHPLTASSTQTIQIRFTNTNTISSQRQSLDNVRASLDSTVQDDLNLGTHSCSDLW